MSTILPENILNGILSNGLLVIGSKKCGKTTAGKVIASEIIRNYPYAQVKFFDVAQNLKYNFEPILYQEINENTRYFYDGDDHILFNINMIDERDIFGFMQKVVLTDYLRQRKRKDELGGHVDRYIIYFTEETQSILGSYSFLRREARKLFKAFCDGRNFGQSYILIGQRLSDLSAKAVERINAYLIGKTSGDNDISKLTRIVGSESPIITEVQKLEVGKGQFFYWDGESTYEFSCPQWKPIDPEKSKPILWQPEHKKVWKYRSGVEKI